MKDGSANSGDDKDAVGITVPSKDPSKRTKTQTKGGTADQDLTEEALKKKMEIELLVERSQDPSEGVAKLALQTLSTELRGGTSSMISVPLPLKFLRPHFSALESYYSALPDTSELKKPLADVLSVLATTVTSTEGLQRAALRYSLAGTREGLTTWGPEYLRNITREIISEYEARQESYLANASTEGAPALELEDLISLVMEVVPFYVNHHNEVDAIDLLVEVQHLDAIVELSDANNYKRITQYLLSLANYAVSEHDARTMLKVAYRIFEKMNEPCECVRVALKLADDNLVLKVLTAYQGDTLVRTQIGYMLGAQRWTFPDAQGEPLSDLVGKDVAAGLTNDWLSEMYKALAKELEVVDAKRPEDVYKTHLDEKKRSSLTLDSAKQNLAATLVNAFVNAGFGNDTLMTVENSDWIYKNKEHGITTAAASLGALMLWDVNPGLNHINNYYTFSDPFVWAGALMGSGLLCSGVQNECDPAFVLLLDQFENNARQAEHKLGALLGLAFAQIGFPREKLLDALVAEVIDSNVSVDISATAALTLGLTYLGTGNEPVASTLLQTLLERQSYPGQLDTPLAFFFALAIGLLFFGQKDGCDATFSALDAVNKHPIGRFAKQCLLGCAYAGTGDVTKVQYFLRLCGGGCDAADAATEGAAEQVKDSDSAKATAGTDDGELSISSFSHQTNGTGLAAGGATLNAASKISQRSAATTAPAQPASAASSTHGATLAGMEQSAALISIALIALGEDVGSSMILRMVDHLLQYGGVAVRRGVPLCLALISSSAPKPAVVEVLSKLTHDPEPDVALNAIFALGLVGAGTNNSRIAELLRQLAIYYSKSANALFLVRISQGLLYMGKGLLTLSPMHSDGFLIRPASLVTLLVVVYSALFMKNTFLSRHHYLLYFLVAGATPRMLITLDTNLQMLPVSVRVGQKVDVAGIAGNPRTITGFQTHTTPVLLAEGERAELATSSYVTVASLPLEGIVILKPSDTNNVATTST